MLWTWLVESLFVAAVAGDLHANYFYVVQVPLPPWSPSTHDVSAWKQQSSWFAGQDFVARWHFWRRNWRLEDRWRGWTTNSTEIPVNWSCQQSVVAKLLASFCRHRICNEVWWSYSIACLFCKLFCCKLFTLPQPYLAQERVTAPARRCVSARSETQRGRGAKDGLAEDDKHAPGPDQWRHWLLRQIFWRCLWVQTCHCSPCHAADIPSGPHHGGVGMAPARDCHVSRMGALRSPCAGSKCAAVPTSTWHWSKDGSDSSQDGTQGAAETPTCSRTGAGQTAHDSRTHASRTVHGHHGFLRWLCKSENTSRNVVSRINSLCAATFSNLGPVKLLDWPVMSAQRCP